MKIPGDFFSGIPLRFRWCLIINSFWCQLGPSLEFSRGHLGINSVWCQLGSPLGFAIPVDSFAGIPPCFPPLGFTLLIRLRGTTFSPVGGLLFFSFIGELHIPPILPPRCLARPLPPLPHPSPILPPPSLPSRFWASCSPRLPLSPIIPLNSAPQVVAALLLSLRLLLPPLTLSSCLVQPLSCPTPLLTPCLPCLLDPVRSAPAASMLWYGSPPLCQPPDPRTFGD